MPTKKGAGGKNQNYDASTGRYGNGTGAKEYRQNTSYAEITEAESARPKKATYEDLENLWAEDAFKELTDAYKAKKATGVKKETPSEANGYKGIMDVVKASESLKENGTYDLETGEKLDLPEGYMANFHQNEPDEKGDYKSHWGRYTPEEYARLTAEIAKKYGAKVYIGRYGEPEVTFCFETKEQALEVMEKYNQESAWDNATYAETGKGELAYIPNPKYDKKQNPMKPEGEEGK